MVVRSLNLEKDVFRPREEGEEILGSGFPYLSLIGALMYLASSTRPDIAFAVNLLARHSAAPTRRKQILRYINGTKDLGLFFQKTNDPKLVGYAELFYPHKLQLSGELNILSTKSCDNMADLFTKSLPASSFEKCVKGIGMRRLRDLQAFGGNP
jgi:hypothetical protein